MVLAVVILHHSCNGDIATQELGLLAQELPQPRQAARQRQRRHLLRRRLVIRQQTIVR